MHTGSEIKDVNVFLQGLEVMFEIARHFDHLEFIDLGSGFKVPYQEGDPETDVDQLGEKVAEAFKAFEQETGKSCKYGLSRANIWLVRLVILW
jgi:diaminopimelate decarboxylase